MLSDFIEQNRLGRKGVKTLVRLLVHFHSFINPDTQKSRKKPGVGQAFKKLTKL